MAPTKLGGNNRESLSKSDREKLIATGKSREKKSDEVTCVHVIHIYMYAG